MRQLDLTIHDMPRGRPGAGDNLFALLCHEFRAGECDLMS